MPKKRKWKPQTRKKEPTYTRLGTYDVQSVLNRVDAEGGKQLFDGHMINMDSSRLLNFKLNGTHCVVCGAQAEFFALELHTRAGDVTPHLNLYARNEHGHELMLTKDHKVPASCGGKNHVSNLQTMCRDCNGLRGHDVHSKNGRAYVLLHKMLSPGKAMSLAIDLGPQLADVEGHKIVCRLTPRQFEYARQSGPDHVVTLDKMGDVALVFRPREEWPEHFRYFPLWK